MKVTRQTVGRIPVSWPLVADTGDALLICGGRSADGPVRNAYRLDKATLHWREVAPMTVPRFGHSAATLADGRVLVLGGDANHGASADGTQIAEENMRAEVWDGERWQLRMFEGIPPLNFSHLTPVGPHRVLLTGGMRSDRTETKRCWLLSTADTSIAATGALAHPRAHHASTWLSAAGVALVVAATDAFTEQWDLASQIWRPAGTVLARSGAQLIGTPSCALLVGGQEPEPMTTVQRWSAEEWHDAQSLPIPAGGTPAVQLSDSTIAILGAGSENTEMLIYDLEREEWTAESGLPRLFGHGIGQVRAGAVLVAGGVFQDTVDVWTFDR